VYRLIVWFSALIVVIIILVAWPMKDKPAVPMVDVLGAAAGHDQKQKDTALHFLNSNMFQDAAPWFKKAALAGDIDASFRLGKLYYEGKLGKGKAKEGGKWIERAAKKGHVHSKFLRAAAMFTGKGVPSDIAGAITQYQEVAAMGYSGGDTNLAWIYHGGHGVPQDFEAGLRHGLKAANAGNADAQFFLAMALYTGHGVERNLVEAIEWCRRAAERHHTDAQRLLAAITLGSQSAHVNQEAIHFFEEAAGDGDFAAMENLAWIYLNGVGTAQDNKQAIHWYQQAAQGGHAESQYNLGLIYEHGRGVEPDFGKAYHWYDSAAKRGYVDAFNKVGEMHRDGKGVPPSPLEALTWFRRAQAKGSASAVRNLATMQQKGFGMEKDWDAARELFRKAAEAGDAEAQLYMGWMYKTGEVGAEVSYDEAIKWYTMAAEQGQSDAQYQLGQMYQKGSGVQRDRVKALKLYQSAAKGSEEKEQEAARRSVEARELPRQFINRYSWSLISPGDQSVLSSMTNVFPEVKIAFSLTPAKSVISSMSELENPTAPAAAPAVAETASAPGTQIVAAPTHATSNTAAAESTSPPGVATVISDASTGTVEVSTPPPAAPAVPDGKVRGSGWICDYGLIVTNYHLVNGRSQVHAMIRDKYEACEVFATDTDSDLALLRPTARIQMPDALPISGRRVASGDKVYAVGYGPNAKSAEIVYSPGTIRAEDGFDNDKLLTVMMSISSENSGGPLLNSRGQVVGIILDKQPAIEEFAAEGDAEAELPGRRNYAVKANQVRLLLRKVKSYDRTKPILFGTSDIDEIIEKMRDSVILVTAE
jgi:uncharacterized protein